MHGPCQHGALGYCFDEGQQDRDIVFRANIERINRADAVFAYIDRGEAYGSPFELGYARGKGKPIFVGFPPKVPWQNDMWFSAQAGLGLKAGHVGEVTTLWRQFCQRLDLEIRLAEWVEETAALGAWQSFNPES
jgi:hypothetical protein